MCKNSPSHFSLLNISVRKSIDFRSAVLELHKSVDLLKYHFKSLKITTDLPMGRQYKTSDFFVLGGGGQKTFSWTGPLYKCRIIITLKPHCTLVFRINVGTRINVLLGICGKFIKRVAPNKRVDGFFLAYSMIQVHFTHFFFKKTISMVVIIKTCWWKFFLQNNKRSSSALVYLEH